jgi:hypothetical protein
MTTLEELNTRIGSLHEAVLLRVDMHWAEGTVTLEKLRTQGAGVERHRTRPPRLGQPV